MLASLFQFSFLCIVALTNLCVGFALASRFGWCPRLGDLFQLNTHRPPTSVMPSDVESPDGMIE